MATPLNATFTAADATALSAVTNDSGGTWTTFAFNGGSNGSGAIITNRLRNGSTTQFLSWTSETISTPRDQEITATWFCKNTTGVSGIGIFVGYDSTAGSGYLCSWGPSSSKVQVFPVTAGRNLGAVIAASNATFSPGANSAFTMKIRVNGSALGVYINDVLFAEVANATFSGTQIGVWFSNTSVSDANGVHLDTLTSDTPSPSSFLPGVVTPGTPTAHTIPATWTPATGGTGPYTYDLEVSLGSSNNVSWVPLATGVTSPGTFAGLGAGLAHAIRVKATDSAGTPHVERTPTAFGTTTAAPGTVTGVVAVGDSLTLGSWVNNYPAAALTVSMPAPYWAARQAEAAGAVPDASYTNRGISGSGTADWMPASGTGYYTAALAAAGTSTTHPWVMICLGTNDSSFSGNVPASTFRTNLEAQVDAWIATGRKVVLLAAPGIQMAQHTAVYGGAVKYDSAALALLASYNTELATIAAARPGTCFFDSANASAYQTYMQAHPELYTEGIHLTPEGYQKKGYYDGIALASAINPPAGPLASGTLSAGTPTQTDVALSWTAASGGTPGYTYQVQRSTDSGASWSNYGASTGSTSQTATGLSASTTYQFRLRVMDAGSGEVFSNVVTVTTAALAPSIALERTVATIYAVVGDTTPGLDALEILNGGGSSLTGLSVSDDGAWLTATLGSTTGPTRVTLLATVGALTAGTYTATVTVASTAPNLTGGSKTITVRFVVLATARVEPTGMSGLVRPRFIRATG